MNIQIPIDAFFFIVPFVIAFLFSLRHSSQLTGGGFFPPTSERMVYWFFITPLTLIISLSSWAIYLRWFK